VEDAPGWRAALETPLDELLQRRRLPHATGAEQDPGDGPPPRPTGGRPRKTPKLADRVHPKAAAEILAALPEEAWVKTAWREGTKGALVKEVARVRFWTGLHRHLALVMLAHSFLTLRQSYGPQIQEGPPMPFQGDRPRSPPPARGFPPGGKKKHRRSSANRA